MSRDDLLRVDGSIQLRTRFSAPYDLAVRTGETIVLRPDDGSVSRLLALVEAVTATADAQGRRIVGSLQILAIVDDDDRLKPVTSVPQFFGDVDMLPTSVGAAYYATVDSMRDPANKKLVQPKRLEVGTLLTDADVPVVFNACGFQRHSVLLAQSGSGKSYALGVLLEEILHATLLRIVVLDPNGDFTTLRHAPLAKRIRIASSRDPQRYRAAVRALSDKRVRCVGFNLNTLDRMLWPSVVEEILGELWEQRDTRRPTVIFIDEAHNFAPSDGRGDAVGDAINRIAAEGRKYGLWLVMASQRPQKLNANVISQCDNLIVMKLSSQIDIDYVAGAYGGTSRDLVQLAAGFKPGSALVAGKIVRSPTLMRFRERQLPEAGGDLPLNWGAVAL